MDANFNRQKQQLEKALALIEYSITQQNYNFVSLRTEVEIMNIQKGLKNLKKVLSLNDN